MNFTSLGEHLPARQRDAGLVNVAAKTMTGEVEHDDYYRQNTDHSKEYFDP